MAAMADHSKRIEKLQKKFVPIDPQDTMAEAGRKLLLNDFITMLSKEAGSRTGEDIECVHDMRVATRRMRSAFRLLNPYFDSKTTAGFQRELKKIAGALGTVRDLDVMIVDLTRFQATLNEEGQAVMQSIIDLVNQRVARGRIKLIKVLEDKAYRTFIKDYGDYLTKSGKDAGAHEQNSAGEVIPHQVRHILPTLVYEQLGAVRAYDMVLAQAEDMTFHALRIEFKRLRYLVSFFAAILGASINGFVEDLKAIQDHLGRLNDISVALEWLDDLRADCPEEAQQRVLSDYMLAIQAEKPELIEQFPAVWEHFNTRTVQRKLADALLVLR